MPIWLRKFTFNKIKEFYEKEAEANQKASKGSNTLDLASPNKIPEAVKNVVKNNPTGKKPSIKAS